MNPESLMHERGSVAVVAHKDAFTREEKDALRSAMVDGTVQFTGQHYMLLITEEQEGMVAFEAHHEDPDHVCDNNDDCEFHEYQGPKDEEVAPGGEPTMADLKALKVAELQKLADSEQVDLTGLKLKDDILGRMAAHFGLDPAS